MSKNYTKISLIQRYETEAYLNTGIKQKIILNENGVHPSSLSKEMSKNIAQCGKTALAYLAANAHCKTDSCHFSKPKLIKFYVNMKKNDVKCYLCKKVLTQKQPHLSSGSSPLTSGYKDFTVCNP